MALPSSEITFWQEYYNIYPLPQERDDERTALIASVIYNTAGKAFKKNIEPGKFLPDYLGERNTTGDKSIEQQQKDFEEFAAKLKAMQGTKPK